jgi:hypothetical protein
MDFDDCTDDFKDIEFWERMRDEHWWMDHPEHFVFYEFWDAWHYSGECHDSGNWYDFECSDFEFMEEGNCRIEVHWNNCDIDQFECQIRRDDDMGYGEDCSMNFRETDFWNVFMNSPTMQNPEFEGFMNFWGDFHFERHCSWDCVDLDCSIAFDLEACHEHSCLNNCDDSLICRVDYVWEGENANENCMSFYNFTAGNNTDPECTQFEIHTRCSEFAFVRA